MNIIYTSLLYTNCVEFPASLTYLCLAFHLENEASERISSNKSVGFTVGTVQCEDNSPSASKPFIRSDRFSIDSYVETMC